MTAVSKNAYFDVLGDIVNKDNNTAHRSIKMKPIDVTSDSYADYNEDSNVTKGKIKIGDRVRISKYWNIFAKEDTQNWAEEVFLVSKIKNAVPWRYVISGVKICWKLFWKRIPKTKSKKFRIEKVIKRKGDKLYVKWKGYDSLFKIWIDKKTLNEILSNAISLYKNKSILSYYPQNFRGNIKVKVDLPNYATKTGLKNVTQVLYWKQI